MSNMMIKLPKKDSIIYTHLELILIVTIWSGTFISTKIVTAQIPPALSALYRYIIASVVLVCINYRNKEKVSKKDFPAFIILGLTGVTLYYLLQHYGIKYTNAIDSSVLISLAPVFIVIISWFLLKERLSLYKILGLVLALIGSILVVTDGKFTSLQGEGRFFGDILILLTAVSWAIYSVYGKKLLNKYKAKTIITYTTLVGTVFLLPFSLFELTHTVPYNLNCIGWLNLLYLGVLASVYGYIGWYRALEKLPASTVGSYLYFRPLLTGVIATIVLQEKAGLFIVIGGILIVIGTYLTARKSF